MLPKNQEINDKAAEWVAKSLLRVLDAREQAKLDAWLAADVRHVGAFTRAKAILSRLDHVSNAVLRKMELERGRRVPYWTRRTAVIASGGLAASVALGCILSLSGAPKTKDPVPVSTNDFATAKGQAREVLLSDGSIITLNTSSRVTVELSPEERKVYLLSGEALFDVAKDKERPFVVYAGGTQVKAVGTSFMVSVLPERPVAVVVREGVVEMKRARTAPVWISANARAFASQDTPILAEPVSSTKIAREMAWQYGRIALDHRTLKEASEEFARYSDVRIVLDRAIANKTVTGMFASNDPVGFAKAAAAVLKLQVEEGDKEVRIFDSSNSKW